MRDPQVWAEAAWGLPSSRGYWDDTVSSAPGPDIPLWPEPSLSDTHLLQIIEQLQPPACLFQVTSRGTAVITSFHQWCPFIRCQAKGLCWVPSILESGRNQVPFPFT